MSVGYVLIEGDTLIGKGQMRGTFCEGTYDCFVASRPRHDGTPGRFQIGDRPRIGFWNVETCKGSTTLGDGSQWTLVPGTCRCN